MKVPMMIFVAGKDEIVSSRASEDFAVGLKVGTHVLCRPRHEILQEPTDPLRFWAFDAYLGLDEAAAVPFPLASGLLSAAADLLTVIPAGAAAR